MKGHVIKPSELGPAELELWQSIQDSSDIYQSPFFSHHFSRSIAEHRDDVWITILEVDGKTVGFFPYHRLRGGVGKPVGGPISDYQGPIVWPSVPIGGDAVLRAAGLKAYDFNHAPARLAALSGGAYARSVSPHMDVSDGYDAYAANQSSKWKRAIKDMQRRMRKTESEIGPLRFTYHDASDEVYAAHIQLKNALFAKLGVRSILDTPWVDRTLNKIRETQMPDFAGVMTTLHAGDQLIGAHFGMRSKTVWHWWFPSYDLDYANRAPGIVIMDQAARHAQNEGLKLIDFGRGESAYKKTYANGGTELCEGSIERVASLAGALRKGQKAVISTARPIPLGKYETYPRRALARLISGMQLPET